MGLFSNAVERSEIVAGDHIYCWRLRVYSHHGIYIGNDLVIHFMAPPKKFTAAHKPCPNHPHCGSRKSGSGVTISCLDCFLEWFLDWSLLKGSLRRCEYGVSTAVSWFQLRGGTCTTAQSDLGITVVQRAMYLFENGFGKYNLVGNNCENFATYCKTGILILTKDKTVVSPLSGQIEHILTGMIVSPNLLVRIGIYDVIKVPVEDMYKYHGRPVRSI